MQFPFGMIPRLSDAQLRRYEQHIDSNETGWHRRWAESIWRRHQHPSNAALSGWKSSSDARRRLVHFYDQYGVAGRQFVLEKSYVSLHLTLPVDDIADYLATIEDSFKAGRWVKGAHGCGSAWSRGDLDAWYAEYEQHPEDRRRHKSQPPGYRHLELRVQTRHYAHPPDLPARPWRWFHEVGLRETLPPGQPTYIQPEDIARYLPAQVELGCGPSMEAGVPALSNLHQIYGVSRPDFSFVFRAADDALLDVLADPEGGYGRMTAIHKACMLAQPTPFYRCLADLWRAGHFVGPVISNNFDCLCLDMGLPEVSLRRYDTEAWFPRYLDAADRDSLIDPRARSLLVVGVHADRRMVQRRARELDLQIIYIDPERYVAPGGAAIDYPVESPQDGDLFVQLPAGEALPRLARALCAGDHVRGEAVPHA
jgi:hypothetical protein